jgi:hypothetical protein
MKDLQIIISTLVKIEPIRWAALRDYKKVLTAEIGSFLKAQHQPQSLLIKASEMLMHKAMNAAEYSGEQTQPACFEWINDPKQAVISDIIENKRISKKMVQAILGNCLNPTGLLKGIAPIQIAELPPGVDVLTQKMEEGRIRKADVNIMKDCDNFALFLLFEWSNSLSPKEADARYEHLRIIVCHECQSAYDFAYDNEEPFGQKMLDIVRNRLQTRETKISQRYDDCYYEHLEGIAGILSEQCIVWWSREFKLKEAI